MPHLGAHLAELVTIGEGNPEHLPDAPHMLNLHKKLMTGKSLLLLARMQRALYTLEAVRIVATAINRSMRSFQCFTAAEAATASREFFKLSQLREGLLVLG